MSYYRRDDERHYEYSEPSHGRDPRLERRLYPDSYATTSPPLPQPTSKRPSRPVESIQGNNKSSITTSAEPSTFNPPTKPRLPPALQSIINSATTTEGILSSYDPKPVIDPLISPLVDELELTDAFKPPVWWDHEGSFIRILAEQSIDEFGFVPPQPEQENV